MKVYKNKKAKEHILSTYDMLLEQWGLAYEERMIENTFGQTHVIVCGKTDGEPIVMFHGVGDDSALMWFYNAKALGENYRIYAIDTIGGPGKSIPGVGYSQTFDDIAWLDSILNALRLEQVHMIGTSHGGYLAMRYLVSRPDKVMKVIGISSVPSSGNKSGSMKLMMKIFLPEALFPKKENVAKLLQKLSGKNSAAFTDNELIMTHYQWLLKGFRNQAMMYHKVTGFTANDLQVINQRAYLLLGELDPFEQYGGEQFVKESKLNAHFYEDAGHGLNHERAEDVNSLILDILGNEVQNIRNY